MRQRDALMLSSVALALVVIAVSPGRAQQQSQSLNLHLPAASPKAAVSQTIGVTDITISFHRPGVRGRKIWGGLVPYGQVWRAGADENTLISFSTEVMINGKPLAAGSYGLHTIPGESEWTVIFSRDITAWGSYSYNQSRDALRVTARPEEAPFQERMSFTFDDVTDDSATLSLRWEKLRVPVSLKADTKKLTLESIRNQLKGVAQFFWIGWSEAAGWALENQIAYEEALGWIDRSIQIEERFENLSTKARLLEQTGKAEEAAKVIERAMMKGTPAQINGYGRSLIAQGKKNEAMKVFQRNAELHPDSYVVHVGLGRGYSALGDFDKAVAAMQRAYDMAPADRKAGVQGLLERLKRKENIN
jgi:predicted methyltransferase